MKKLSLTLLRNSLLTIYKTFARHVLGYSDIIYDKLLIESFKDKSGMVQYNAALVITGAFKGTSRGSIYRELGLESLDERRWSRKIFFFHKIINGILPVYLQSYISYCGEGVYRTRSANQKSLKQLSKRTKIFESSFFPIVLKSGIILMRSFGKLNQQFNLKQKFTVSSDPKKTQFLRFMT